MSYQDIVLADSPKFYWPLEATVSGVHQYFPELVNTYGLLYGSQPKYALLTGTGETFKHAPDLVTPGLLTAGPITQWVTTMGVGARNTTKGAATDPNSDEAETNVLYPTTGSMELWFRWQDPLVSGSTYSWAYIFGRQTTNNYAPWQLIAYGADIILRYVAVIGGGSVDYRQINISNVNIGATDSLADGILHHLAFVFDHAAATCKVYLDGRSRNGQQIPGLAAGTTYQDATDWWGSIGISPFRPQTQVAASLSSGGGVSYTGWNGQLGHLAIYNTKLTADQIQMHWLVGGTTPVFPDSLNSVSGAEIIIRPSAPLTVASTSGMHASVRLSLIRLSHIEGYFAPYGVRLAGATVWGELAQVGTSKAVMHKSGVVMSTRTSNYTTNSAGYLVMDIAPPQDVVPPHAHWELHWTGGTPVS